MGDIIQTINHNCSYCGGFKTKRKKPDHEALQSMAETERTFIHIGGSGFTPDGTDADINLCWPCIKKVIESVLGAPK